MEQTEGWEEWIIKYAIISDIHGNLPALEAVLADAAEQGVDGYFFLGDYYEDFPWPNEVAEKVRGLENAQMVRGNKEDYLCNLDKEDPSTWTHVQIAALYWNYRNFSEENRSYLMNLPESLEVSLEGGGKALLTHTSRTVFGVPESGVISASGYSRAFEQEGFSREQFYAELRRELATQMNGKVPSADVYLFGHMHLQWHTELNGKLFLNPGSCGLPLDWDVNAPYTILECGRHGRTVAERRVAYDLPEAIRLMKASDIYRAAPIWCDVIILELERATETVSLFLDYAEGLAAERGEGFWPMPNATFQEAYELWYPMQLSNSPAKKSMEAIE